MSDEDFDGIAEHYAKRAAARFVKPLKEQVRILKIQVRDLRVENRNLRLENKRLQEQVKNG